MDGYREASGKTFSFVILWILALVSYMLFAELKLSKVKLKQQPVPAAINVNEQLFKALANVGPNQQVDVEIVDQGKVTIPSEKFSFSYSITNVALDEYRRSLELAETKKKQPPRWNGYLKVISVGEELSKGMKNFLSLAYLMAPDKAKLKIVAPKFRNGGSALGATGSPFEEFFDLNNLNKILSSNGYSVLVKQEEYEMECKGQIIFVVQDLTPESPKRGLLTPEVYHELFEKRGTSWVDCKPKDNNDGNNKKEFVCTRRKDFDMTVLQKTVLKNAKCIEIPMWNDHGYSQVYEAMGEDRLNTARIFTWLAKPSDMLIKEAKRFEELTLQRPYVAIHIRSVHIRQPPSTPERCFKLALRFVKALKSTRNVKSVFIASDMTKFGSVASHRNLQDEFAATAAAVTYQPNITGQLEIIQQASVSLTEMLLLTQSDHLITLGTGSYHSFIVDRFRMHHLNMNPSKWSLIKICNNAR